jgi:hypothetical protein
LLGIVQRYFSPLWKTDLIPGMPITIPGSAEN